jgi:outer membrane protein OmpA-like peptidoglycan-associated protein
MYAQTYRQSQQEKSGDFAPPGAARSQEMRSILQMQSAVGDQSAQWLQRAQRDGVKGMSCGTASGICDHNFARIPVHAKAPVKIQAKLAVSTPGDTSEEEADRVSEQVMRMPAPQFEGTCPLGRQYHKCEVEQPSQAPWRLRKKGTGASDIGRATPPPIVHEVLSAPGHPLDPSTLGFMEPRFGHDLSHVRIHTDRKAAESAHAVGALAYTVGNDVVFAEGEFSPRTHLGRRLLAHELVHTLQQSMSAEPAGVLYRQTSLDIALRSPGVAAQVLGTEILDGFELNSHTLTAKHTGRLLVLAKKLREMLREHQLVTVKITGHTDATGEESFNDQLGQDRADAVAAFLRRAGVPAVALLAESAGERALRVPTDKAEPRNRRVEIRFLPDPASSSPTPEPGTTEPPVKPVRVPRPENLCTEYPEICEPITTKPETMPSCGSTNCSAVSLDSFDKQPPDLRLVLIKSRGTKDDAAEWFEQLDSESRMAVTQIFSRLCQFGVWCHTRYIVRIAPAEAPVLLADRIFNVPGRTASVYFMSPSGNALIQALMATGRFCMAQGAGASQHRGQTTLREISGSDSLHISIGPGDQFDAHIDKYSPVPEHPGGSFCSNDPTPAAVGHIGRELVPEKVREGLQVLGLHIPGPPGVQVFPDLPVGVPAPPGAVGSEPVPEVIRLTLRGPVKDRKQTSNAEALPAGIERLLADEIPKRFPRNALVPPGAERTLAAATRAADQAGPGEEAALLAARETAREHLESFADDAHYFAQDMGRRMDQARRSGRPDFAVQLGESYAKLTPDDRKYILGQIRDIARNVRVLLAERAAGVHKIWVAFGDSVIWDVDF